ncbi:MAG TPA: GTPase HflX [Clostridiaceae bacterium]
MIYGNIEGVKESLLNKLEELYKLETFKYTAASEDLINVLISVTSSIKREISVAVNRRGKIVSVAIGDSSTVDIPELDFKLRNLSGIRIIHTHPAGSSKLSVLDISALIKLKLDCIVAIGISDEKVEYSFGFCSFFEDKLTYEILGPINREEFLGVDIFRKVEHIEEYLKNNKIIEDNSEKALIVGTDTAESLEELRELAKACQIEVCDSVFQNRNKVDTAFYVGSGKVEEIAYICQSLRANLVIFDDELSGSQVRNLEDKLGIKVIDRTVLILDIFAKRARSKEAKIQVELAQLKYRLPRLTGLGTILSRTGGGIGTRGPGEKKLETDRRHIKERLYDLKDELDKIRKTRETQRDKRNKEFIPKISIVGYTNAGKSTLRNKLCEIANPKNNPIKEKVFEADMLFATLDVTTRAIILPDNRLVTVTDTVGFVRKLPHDLVEAFKSTLEEVIYSDLLIHVIDASATTFLTQLEVVNNVLEELGAHDKPTILVLNKIDLLDKDNNEELIKSLKGLKVIEISAKKLINLDELLVEIQNTLPNTLMETELLIPYAKQEVTAYLHRKSKILIEEFKDDGTYIKALIDAEISNRCSAYIINK